MADCAEEILTCWQSQLYWLSHEFQKLGTGKLMQRIENGADKDMKSDTIKSKLENWRELKWV